MDGRMRKLVVGCLLKCPFGVNRKKTEDILDFGCDKNSRSLMGWEANTKITPSIKEQKREGEESLLKRNHKTTLVEQQAWLKEVETTTGVCVFIDNEYFLVGQCPVRVAHSNDP